MRACVTIGLVVVVVMAVTGCIQQRSDPSRAVRPYPYELHVVELEGDDAGTAPVVTDVQVFRDGPWIEIVNSTARSFRDLDVWVNQRYMRHLDELPAGRTVRLSLFEFYDELGEAFNAGGFWRSIEPAPVLLVELQPSPTEPLLGLIAIPE